MTRSLWTFTAALFISVSGAEAAAQTRRPNIVVIVADDMGYADIGIHGSKDIPTPNIDALAAEGVRFTDAYVSGPYCGPTRAGLLTGKYPQRFGQEFNLGGRAHREVGLPVDQVTIADRLKAANYRTALIGKWHLGVAPRFFPLRRGFDEFYGFLAGGHSYVNVGPDAAPIYDGNEIVREAPYLTDAFADRAVEFIKRNRQQPFFLYLAFNAVHVPLQATEKYLARVQHISDTTRRTYAAMLMAMDDGIGKTLATLRSEGLDENTLVFFFSDNGGPIGTNAQGREIGNGSSNAPLRGSKGTTWEGGIRVPFIVRWKGTILAGRTESHPIIQLDVMPTALAAAGVPVPAAWKLDGVDLLPLLTGTSSRVPHAALYWRLGGNMAIRQGDWKLVKVAEGGANDTTPPTLAGAQLFNLEADTGETNNLAAAEPAKRRELLAAWQRWNRELAKPAWPPPGPAPASITGVPGTSR